MKKLRFTEKEVVGLLKQKQGKRTQKAYAGALGISGQLLSDIYALRRSPGGAVLLYLGLVRGYFRAPVRLKAKKVAKAKSQRPKTRKKESNFVREIAF